MVSESEHSPAISIEEAISRSAARGLVRLKPRILFQAVERRFGGAPVELNLQIPSSEIGSITMLEAAQLVALVRLCRPTRIVEIGTYFGFTTRLFLDNSDENCHVFTVDLPEEVVLDAEARELDDDVLHSDGDLNDEYLRWRQLGSDPRFLSNLSASQRSRLSLVKADSRTISSDLFEKRGDFGDTLVFIDGGHDKDTVANDTDLALSLVRDRGAIVWHDFESAIHSGVSPNVGRRAMDETIFAVESTLLAFELRGRSFVHLMG